MVKEDTLKYQQTKEEANEVDYDDEQAKEEASEAAKEQDLPDINFYKVKHEEPSASEEPRGLTNPSAFDTIFGKLHQNLKDLDEGEQQSVKYAGDGVRKVGDDRGSAIDDAGVDKLNEMRMRLRVTEKAKADENAEENTEVKTKETKVAAEQPQHEDKEVVTINEALKERVEALKEKALKDKVAVEQPKRPFDTLKEEEAKEVDYDDDQAKEEAKEAAKDVEQDEKQAGVEQQQSQEQDDIDLDLEGKGLADASPLKTVERLGQRLLNSSTPISGAANEDVDQAEQDQAEQEVAEAEQEEPEIRQPAIAKRQADVKEVNIDKQSTKVDGNAPSDPDMNIFERLNDLGHNLKNRKAWQDYIREADHQSDEDLRVDEDDEAESVSKTPTPNVWRKVGRWTEKNSTRAWRQNEEDGTSKSLDPMEDMGAFGMLNAYGVAKLGHPDGEGIRRKHKPQIVQVLVLTTSGTESRARLDSLLSGLDELGLSNITHAFDGVDAHKYKNEAEEMSQEIIPMSPKERKEWLQTRTGEDKHPMHKTNTGWKSPEEFPSNGALACSLGHHHLWERASAASADPESTHAWTIILEDDAHITNTADTHAIERILTSAPPDVHLVHLDDRHCKYSYEGVRGKDMDPWAPGSTAYAVTNVGAKMLLSEPFSYLADHWLNVPVHNGKMKALCPGGTPVFQHEYNHESTIKSHTTKA